MGFFQKLFGKPMNQFAAPVAGNAVPLSQVPDPTFAEELLEYADVAVVPGSAFCTEGFCRLSYATSLEQIDRGLTRIAGFVASLT